MMYAKKIKMKYGCSNSNNVQEIEEIYIDGCNNPGYFKKSVLYDYLKKNPGSIKVYISPYPDVLPALSSRGENMFVQNLMIQNETIYLNYQEYERSERVWLFITAEKLGLLEKP